jgi:hypothetical protein
LSCFPALAFRSPRRSPVVSGVDAPHYALLADLARCLLPYIIHIGIANAETVAIDTLEIRLKAAVIEAHSEVEWSAQMCAWTPV